MIFPKINFNEIEPIYTQIEKYIIEMINNGTIISESKLPATRELAKQLGVSRNSVISAYENLEAEGIVYTEKGKGTFISKQKVKKADSWKLSWECFQLLCQKKLKN